MANVGHCIHKSPFDRLSQKFQVKQCQILPKKKITDN